MGLNSLTSLELPLMVTSGESRARIFQMFGGQAALSAAAHARCVEESQGLHRAREAAIFLDPVTDRSMSHPIVGDLERISRPRLIISLRVRKVSKLILNGLVVGRVKLRGHFWDSVSDYRAIELSQLESAPTRYARVTRNCELKVANASYQYCAWSDKKNKGNTV